MVRLQPLGLFALIILSVLFIPLKSVRSEEQSIRDAVVGAWDLVSLYDEDDSGLEVLTFGRHPRGRLMLDFEGNFHFRSSTTCICPCRIAARPT